MCQALKLRRKGGEAWQDEFSEPAGGREEVSPASLGELDRVKIAIQIQI